MNVSCMTFVYMTVSCTHEISTIWSLKEDLHDNTRGHAYMSVGHPTSFRPRQRAAKRVRISFLLL